MKREVYQKKQQPKWTS